MVQGTLPLLTIAEERSPIPVCPLAVEADVTGAPCSVKISGQWIEVREVVDRWVIDGEWTTGQIAGRMYWECLMSKGLRITVYRDIDSGRWYW